jgi:Protein of unknown function (DUF1648)
LSLTTALVACLASLAVSGLIGLLFYGKIKVHAAVPIHFDFKGQPDSYGSPLLAAFLIPLIYALFSAVLLGVSLIEQLDAATVLETRQGAMAIGPVLILAQLLIITITLRALGRSGR